MERIGIGKRFLAFVIDFLLILLLYIPLFGIFFLTDRLPTDSRTAQFTWQVPFVFLSILYWASEIYFAGSPGKHIIGLRIGADDGDIAPTEDLVKRFCMKHIALVGSAAILGLSFLAIVLYPLFFVVSILSVIVSIGSLVFGFGHLLMLTSSRQALHDRLAFTAVYRKSDRIAPAQETETIERPRRGLDPNELIKPRK